MSDPLLVPLLFLLAAILLGLSLLGQWLRSRFGAEGRNTVIEAFNARMAAWWVMLLFLCLTALLGRGGAMVLFALLSFLTLREFLTLTKKHRSDHFALLAAFFLVLPVQYVLTARGWSGLFAVLIPVYAFLFLPVVSALRGTARDFLARVSETQWGLMICVYALSHAAALLTLDIPGYAGREMSLVVWLVVVVQSAEALQEVWGLLIGRHPIAPAISTARNWEGAAGGVVSAALIGMAFAPVTPFSPLEAGAMALAVAVTGLSGGLVMTAIKRDRGVRDWGYLAARHGGFLDRLDSVIFAAPILFHLTRFFWVGT